MFDPHRTRRSDRRYYTRKGQVLQASRVNVNPTIDQRLVPIYKNYLIKNNLISVAPPQPPSPPLPTETITPMGIAIQKPNMETVFFPFNEMNLNTEPSFTLRAESLNRFAVLLVFQQTSLGYYEFSTSTFLSAVSLEITNNVKCYWTYSTSIATSSSDYLNCAKSLYHTSPSTENIFLSFDPSVGGSTENLTISQRLNIEL